MTHPLRKATEMFPAASLALGLAVSCSLAAWGIVRLIHRTDRPRVFLLGDSCIGNYRLRPGHRFQDLLQRTNPAFSFDNLAEPGATPLDYAMELFKGDFLLGEPDRVVMALTPDQLLGGDSHRLSDDGASLRWMPWNRSGLDLWMDLSPRDREVALVQQANLLLFGWVDVLQALWVHHFLWPWDRHHMLSGGLHRRERIYEHAVAVGKGLETVQIGSLPRFMENPRAQDAAKVLEILHRKRIPTLVVILPFANPSLIEKAFSPLALAKRDTSIARTRQWLDLQGAAYIDLNQPQNIAQFPDSRWDDHVHLKDPRAFAYMATMVDDWIRSPSSRSR
jgi:hypothetical protein